MMVSNEPAGRGRYYHAGVGVAAVTSLLTVWTTIVRDDGNGLGFFLLIMAAGVGGFAARFAAAGMARTMAGVAVMQLCVGLAIATAPVTAQVPGAPAQILIFSGAFALAWLISAACFRAAAKKSR